MSETLTEEDLDKVFIGQWEVTQIDDYRSPKAGKSQSSTVVRSKVDHTENTITLYSHIHSRYGEQDITMDGSVGIYGKITERFFISDATVTRVDFLWIRLIHPDKINSSKKEIVEGKKYIIETEAEIDDIVFNGDGKYVFPVKYYIDIIHKQSLLRGIEIIIPIDKFNHYVHMRNLWYRDYKGSDKIPPQKKFE